MPKSSATSLLHLRRLLRPPSPPIALNTRRAARSCSDGAQHNPVLPKRPVICPRVQYQFWSQPSRLFRSSAPARRDACSLLTLAVCLFNNHKRPAHEHTFASFLLCGIGIGKCGTARSSWASAQDVRSFVSGHATTLTRIQVTPALADGSSPSSTVPFACTAGEITDSTYSVHVAILELSSRRGCIVLPRCST